MDVLDSRHVLLRILGVIVLVFWLGWVVRSAMLARRLLRIDVVRGKRVAARGRVPLEVLHEIEDVLSRAKATCVVVVQLDGRDGVRARVTTGSLDEGALQRVRNVVGRHPRARLEAGPRFVR